MSSAIEKVGSIHQPKLIEKLRVGSLIGLATILSFAAASDPTPTLERNIKSLAMVTVAFGLSSAALLDAIKPDKDKEARRTIELVKQEADVIVAEATEYYARLHPTKFVNGHRPSDSFIENFARNLIEQEGDFLALPQADTVEFNPELQLQQYEEIEVNDAFDSLSESFVNPIESGGSINANLPTSLGGVTKAVQHQSFVIPEEKEDDWLDRLIAPSVLLIFGGDGSGKTSMALELLRRRKEYGHQLIAFDPHAHPNKWPDCQVVGDGLNFNKINASITQLQSIIKTRYEQIGSGEVAPCQFPPITFVMEEMTDWKSQVPNADLLITKAGDYRKINIHLVLVAHGDTMNQIGAPKGSNEVIKNCVTKLRLFSKPSREGNPIPAMRGELAFPLSNPVSVKVPKFNHAIPSETVVSPNITESTFNEDLNDSAMVQNDSLFRDDSLFRAKRFQHPTLEFSYTEPPILEFLDLRPDLKAIVSLVVKNNGILDARTIRQRANSNSALKDNEGSAIDTDTIRERFIELKENYPGSFELHNQGNSLTVKDPVLFQMVNANH
jgi:hypothetical protein